MSGTREVHRRLEERLASFLGTNAAVLFGSGYLANIGAITALAADGGVIFSDEKNHASIVDACRLSRARVEIYRHNDAAHLRELLEAGAPEPGPRIVVTESIFSMDGDAAPLDEICCTAERAGAWVVVDEAHAFGVAGPGGRGLAHEPAMSGRVHAIIGTLGKAAGAYGAFVAGSTTLVEYLRNRARPYMFSTALPPGVAAAALAGVEIIAGEEGGRLRRRLAEVCGALRAGLVAGGWRPGGGDGAIIPLIIRDAEQAVALADNLYSKGLLVGAMRYPTVARGTERLRLVASAALTDDDVKKALAALVAARRECR